jgi:partner of Y14 and mago protein
MSSWEERGGEEESGEGKPTIIPGSRRPDGTWRKEVKVRAGYIPQDEMSKYVSSGTKYEREREAMGVVGWGKQEEKKEMTQAQKKNMARKKKREQKAPQQEEVKPPAAAAVPKKTPPPNPEGKKGVKKEENKEEKKEEPVEEKGGEVNKDAKIKALKKKIRQVEQLVEKQQSGAKLNDDQLLKVGRLSDLQQELANLEL